LSGFRVGKYKRVNGDELSALEKRSLPRFGRRFAFARKRPNPMHIQAGNHAVADNDHGFRHFKDGEGERHFEHVVKFEQPFDAVPNILVALNRLDIASDLRLSVTAEKITTRGFTLRYTTWANAQVLGVGAQWMAFHAGLSDFRLTGRIL
jgi:H-type lectin domain